MKLIYIDDSLDEYTHISNILDKLSVDFDFEYDSTLNNGYVPYNDGTISFQDTEQLKRIEKVLEDNWDEVSIIIIDMVLNSKQSLKPPISLKAVRSFVNSSEGKKTMLRNKKKVILFVTGKIDFINHLTGDKDWDDNLFKATYKPSEGKFEKFEGCSLRECCPRYKDGRFKNCTYHDCFKNSLHIYIEDVKSVQEMVE